MAAFIPLFTPACKGGETLNIRYCNIVSEAMPAKSRMAPAFRHNTMCKQ
jgi:hypothetical protein